MQPLSRKITDIDRDVALFGAMCSAGSRKLGPFSSSAHRFQHAENSAHCGRNGASFARGDCLRPATEVFGCKWTGGYSKHWLIHPCR